MPAGTENRGFKARNWSGESQNWAGFVRPRGLTSFNPRQVTHSPPAGKRVWVERYSSVILTVLGVYYTNSIDDNAFDLCLIYLSNIFIRVVCGHSNVQFY